MRITHFRIENFKTIRLAECANPPDFMVICGANGCGKSAFLSALVLAKETAGRYTPGPSVQPISISADAKECRVAITFAFDERDLAFLRSPPKVPHFQNPQPFSGTTATLIVASQREQTDRPPTSQCHDAVSRLLSSYSRGVDSPGFFDFIDAQRVYPRQQLSSWEPQSTSDEVAKGTLVAPGLEHMGLMQPQMLKFQMTKRYLASLAMRDLQILQTALRSGSTLAPADSLAEFRRLFNELLAPLKFVEVDISVTPFRYVISTPRGEIDIDDLSSGEKEILNVFARFHQLRPQGSIILFDEADAHLHPDLQRRYLKVLRTFAKGNQLWLTTHSPEMMIEAGSEHLYTIARVPVGNNANQFFRVTKSDELHVALSEVMGSHGFLSFNQRVVFIEGTDSSADRAIYEAFYPRESHDITFVPAGDSGTTRKTAERVNGLLTAGSTFQFFFSIVDGDIDRAEPDPTKGTRLFRLPVYHVENFLLNEELILGATKSMLGAKCPFSDSSEIVHALKNSLFDDVHLKPFTRALLDAKLNALAKQAHDAVYAGAAKSLVPDERPDYSSVEKDARTLLSDAIDKNEWKARCKGRDLLKAYCAPLGLKYEHFRNCLISNPGTPPPALDEIMRKILM